MDNMWQCEVCGFFQDNRESTCTSCGADRPVSKSAQSASKTKVKYQPVPPKYSPDIKLYLANKTNAKFLRGETRRPASLANSVLGWGCFIPFISIFLIVGIGMLIYGVVELKRDLDLRRDGMVTTGRQVANRIYEDSEGDSYYLTYSFVVNDQPYQREQSVDWDRYNSFESGAPIEIRYLPNNPSQSRIEGTGNAALFMLPFGGCWTAFVLFFIWGFASQSDKNNRIAQKGTLIEGEIVSIDAREDSDNDYNVTLKYSYISPKDGRVIHKKTKFVANDQKKDGLPLSGTKLAILYVDDKNHAVL